VRGTLGLERLGIERGEAALVASGMAVLALLGWADAAVQVVSETLFLGESGPGPKYLPIAFLVSAALLIVTTTLVARALGRVSRPQALPLMLCVLAVALVPLWWGVRAGDESTTVVLLLVAQQFKALGLLVFWVALGDLLHARQAKRLFAPLMAGLTMGSILGSFSAREIAVLTSPSPEDLHLEWLLAFSALLLLLAALATLPLRRRAASRLDRSLGDIALDARTVAPPGAGAATSGPGLGAIWNQSALFRLLAVGALCAGALGPMLYFQYATVAAETNPDREALLTFLATVQGSISFFVLLTQLGLSSRIFKAIGVPTAVMLWPIVYLAGFLGLASSFTRIPAIIAVSGAKLSGHTLGDPGMRILFALFPEELRARAMGLLEGPIKRSGGAIGNVIVLAITMLWLGQAHWVSYSAIPIALAWLGVTIALRRAYPTLLVAASGSLAEDLPAEGASALLDSTTVRQLAGRLLDADERHFRSAVALVLEAPPDQAISVLAQAAGEAGPDRRGELIHALDDVLEESVAGQLESGVAAGPVAKLLDEDPRLSEPDHADLVQAYGRLVMCDGPSAEAEERLRRALEDPQGAVHLAARAALARLGAPDAPGAALIEELEHAVRTGSPAVRRTAREELRALLLSGRPGVDFERRLALLIELLPHEDGAETALALADVAERHGEAALPAAEALLKHRDTESPGLRLALIRYVGYVGFEDYASWLVPFLSSSRPEETRAARAALLNLGVGAAEALLKEHAFGSRRSRDAILSIVRALPIDAKFLEELYQREVAGVQHTVMQLHALERGSPSPLLLQRLEERVDEGLHAALLFLTAIHDDDRVGRLGRRLRYGKGERERAIILEALEAVLRPDERNRLVPLIEGSSLEQRARIASQQLGKRIPSTDQAWREVREDPDSLTRELAWSADPLSGMTGTGTEGGSPTALAQSLRAVEIFAHLSTRQLLDLAKRVQAEAHGPGALIYEEGSPGKSLYVVTDGSVELFRGDHSFGRFGRGEVFGGVGVLDGEPRPTDARTVEGATVLRIDQEVLFPLIEEQPSIAIAICYSLAVQVRALTDRMLG
jgi:hypothetical protein